jgi:hypothetical protein
MLTLGGVGKRVRRLVARARAAWAAWAAWKEAGEQDSMTLESLAEQVRALRAELRQARWSGPMPDDGEALPPPHPGALAVDDGDTIHGGGAGKDWELGSEHGGQKGDAEGGKRANRKKRGRGPDKRPRKPGTGQWQSRHLAVLPSVKRRVEHLAANPAVLPEIEHPKKRRYVLAFAETGNRTQAAEIAGVGRTTPYSRDWREDLVLQAALRQAEEAAADLLEREAFRRAFEGVEKPTGW